MGIAMFYTLPMGILSWVRHHKHIDKKKHHVKMMTWTAGLMALGFATAFLHKSSLGVEHFSSLHSEVGLLSLLALALQGSGGAGLRYLSYQYPWIAQYAKYPHKLAAFPVYFLSSFAVMAAVRTKWSRSNPVIGIRVVNFFLFITVPLLFLSVLIFFFFSSSGSGKPDKSKSPREEDTMRLLNSRSPSAYDSGSTAINGGAAKVSRVRGKYA
uniref:Cytochrome b561 domain-containing protein n=1 Tax=Chromera velia CCMP2878 TaxID=1169474 RepID=A0A0G4FP07_9ALVE|eukprot:Cvel_3559.t1-p1 / transcript=Cvel_3559.t1 / gene=Cvel_3559 / organism=Chromera_velia_CCMP2878 / gene_product=hypothetical protein / transcript_product=hypothetical protein / location=Cvel_scaffold145:88565-89483(+) / protein_length=211 / sequence_SO=supercontig / SO=protein_coding / is_pseudo=false